MKMQQGESLIKAKDREIDAQFDQLAAMASSVEELQEIERRRDGAHRLLLKAVLQTW